MSPLSGSACLRIGALTGCLAFAAPPAFADMASFSYPPFAAEGTGGAIIGGASITLPNSGDPEFFITFVLPRDYVNNTEVKIYFYLSQGGASACQIRFQPQQMVRKRVGSATVNALTGLSSGDNLASFSATPSVIVQKIFTLVAGATPTGQLRGDAFSIAFRRVSGDANDTCSGNAFVQAIDIRYKQTP